MILCYHLPRHFFFISFSFFFFNFVCRWPFDFMMPWHREKTADWRFLHLEELGTIQRERNSNPNTTAGQILKYFAQVDAIHRMYYVIKTKNQMSKLQWFFRQFLSYFFFLCVCIHSSIVLHSLTCAHLHTTNFNGLNLRTTTKINIT